MLPIQSWPASAQPSSNQSSTNLSPSPNDGSSNYPAPYNNQSAADWLSSFVPREASDVKFDRTTFSEQTYHDLSQYTLGLQGLDSKVACEQVTQTPITFTTRPDAPGMLRIGGVCPLGRDVLPSNTSYFSINGIKTLGFWACGDGEPDTGGSFNSYFLYLDGHQDYSNVFGKIRCTISAKAAVFPVTFSRQSGTFSINETEAQIASTSYPSDPIKFWILWLGNLISEGQGYWGNSVAESVFSTAVETNSSSSTEDTNPVDLKLVGYMIQGIIEYQVRASSRRLKVILISLFHLSTGDVHAYDTHA